jgi:periplasmic divalent cation tolerance protein
MALMSGTGAILVLTTLPATFDVALFARTLVTERLAACVSVYGPMQSFYRWKGAVEEDEERQVVIKTTAATLPALEQRFASLHPYEVPELVALPIEEGGAAYLDWLRESTR